MDMQFADILAGKLAGPGKNKHQARGRSTVRVVRPRSARNRRPAGAGTATDDRFERRTERRAAEPDDRDAGRHRAARQAHRWSSPDRLILPIATSFSDIDRTADDRKPRPSRSQPLPPASTPTTRSIGGPGDRRPSRRRSDAKPDPSLDRLCRLPLVPCHGPRELRGRRDRGADEPRFRQHQGRSRGAAGHRPDLHEALACPWRAGRLAADHVPDPRRRAVLGRHLLPATSRAMAGPAFVAVLEAVAARLRDEPEQGRRRTAATHRARSASRRQPASATGSIAAFSTRPPRRVLRLCRSESRRHPRRAEIPQCQRCSNCSGAPATGPATAAIATQSCHAPQHLPGRHLRPSRRRLRPLLGRRRLAGPAFREDALRQRPAPRAADLRLARHRRIPCSGPAIDETVAWLLREMQRRGRRLRRKPRRRFGRPRGQVLRLAARRSRSTSSARTSRPFARVYDITPGGNCEGASILNRLARRASLDRDEARLAGARRRLLERRTIAHPPETDDKVLADWNGLMIAGARLRRRRLAGADWIAADRRLSFIFDTDDAGRPPRPRLAGRQARLSRPRHRLCRR